MKVLFVGDLEDPQDERKATEFLKTDDFMIALWDIQQMFRNILKYENIHHKGYLTDEEYSVVEKLQKDFFEILDEHDIRQIIERQ